MSLGTVGPWTATRRRPGKAWALVLVVLGVATAAQASNMGFKRRFSFGEAGSPLHWVSLPLDYVGADAEALCDDLGGASSVGFIVRWNEASSSFEGHACGDPSPFLLEQGVGYGVMNAPGASIAGTVVGAHVDGYGFLLASTIGSNLSWLSVPYHLDLPEEPGTPPGQDAEDLCASAGVSDVFAVVAWDELTGAYVAHACGSELIAPFPILPGVAYALVNRDGQDIDWQAPVYGEGE